MNVTSATPAALGRALRELRGVPRASAERIRRFARNPAEEFRRNVERTEYGYPVPVVAMIDVVVVLVVGIIAMLHRYQDGYFPSVLPIVALVVLNLHLPLYAFLGIFPKPLIVTVLTMSAAALFLVQPVPTDIAPFVLFAAAGEVAAITPMLVSIPVACAMLAELVFFTSIGHVDLPLPVWVVGILCGWMVGQLLNYQRRYLFQERENQEVRAVQAADDERRRIAREVHDVIAHSLSITLLHVTAARHALQTDRDVDEAVDALTDAERLGRQAMADIRRTVGLLDQRPASQAPEPGLEDVGDLVADFVRAGMTVDYRLDGDAASVSAGIGLALYRISQESLANIAKHAPGARARLRIAISASEIRVDVSNTLPPGAAARPGRGMGISGMRQRIGLLDGTLTAGPYDGGWHVHARIPLTGEPVTGLGCIAVAAEDSLRTALQSMTRKFEARPDALAPKEIQEGA
ncbi:sensor histidine kinase [Nocardia crassostreae]|uniref:sensor histidine kinase n=1 Tax=Nocardia crassostreae TaxID=53428 RepID=UPI0008336741|nr:histidine kinase [Nocardia crassostreae]